MNHYGFKKNNETRKILVFLATSRNITFFFLRELHEGISPAPADGLSVIINNKRLDKVFEMYKTRDPALLLLC